MASTPAPTPPRQRGHSEVRPRHARREINGALSGSTTVSGEHERALGPLVVPESGYTERRPKGGIEGLIGKRVAAATAHALDGPNQTLMRAQKPVWDALCKY